MSLYLCKPVFFCFDAFTVTDSGIGIPEKDFPRFLDPFHRGTNVESIRGKGLGFSLAREFARLHGGDVTFETRENAGTTFKVIFLLTLP